MPPIEAENLETEPVKEVAPASKATIGIIYPPPEVRSILLYEIDVAKLTHTIFYSSLVSLNFTVF